MKMSEHGLELLQQWEGCVLHVYKDSAGYPTVGIGHLLTPSEKAAQSVVINGESIPLTSGITNVQALNLLAQDVTPAENCVNAFCKVELSQNQFDALVSFTFNCGTGAFKSSTLLRLLNQGQYDAVPDQLMKWIKAGGKQCDGLVVRRRNEVKLWRGEI